MNKGVKRERAGKMHANRRLNRLSRSSGNFVLKDDDGGRQIPLPRRSDIEKHLPKGPKGSAINKRLAEKLLRKERYAFVKDIELVDEKMWINDTDGMVHLCMATKEPSSNRLTSEETSTRNFAAAGEVRNQGEHVLCWDFCVCDLVSASAVLHGHMKKYLPLSQKYLCQEVDKKKYVKRVVKLEDGERQTHKCYKSEMFRALMHLKKSSQGIPRANKEEMSETFDCNVERKFGKDEKRFAIKNVYRYDSLEDALWRLEVHPVAATLIAFEGWEEEGVYMGPTTNDAKYLGLHGVLMLNCVKDKSGKMVVRCKSSNGTEVFNGGYIHVSLDVMVMAVAGTETEDEDGQIITCLKGPTHLLCDFYSVDMPMAPNGGQIYEDEIRKMKNISFRV